MKHDQVLRIGSLVGKNKVRDAARHNLRELPQEPHIDPARSHLNRVLRGAEIADEVARQARSVMDASDIGKVRKNGIVGLELIISLPPMFSSDAAAFFNDALAWAADFYAIPIVSAIVHADESTPHMHVVMVPILDGRLQGSAVAGDRKRIQHMHSDFHAKVGVHYGLRRRTAHRLSGAVRRKAAAAIVEALARNPAMLVGGLVKNVLQELIAQNLQSVAGAMGVPLPEAEIKGTFAAIMTKPQRKKTSIEIQPRIEKNPIEVSGLEKAMSYPVLGDCDFSPVDSTHTCDFTRLRDDELSAGWGGSERGAFKKIVALTCFKTPETKHKEAAPS
jgi:hypothetical protein